MSNWRWVRWVPTVVLTPLCVWAWQEDGSPPWDVAVLVVGVCVLPFALWRWIERQWNDS